MEYVYAAMLLSKAGKDVSEDSVTAVLKAAGVNVDGTKVKSLVASLEGVDVNKIIEENSSFVGSAPAASSGAPAASSGAPAPAEEKKKEEPPQADAAAGLGSLF